MPTTQALIFQKRLNDFRKQASLVEMTSCASVGNVMMTAEEISSTAAWLDTMRVSENKSNLQEAVYRYIKLFW